MSLMSVFNALEHIDYTHKSSVKALHTCQFQVKDQQTFDSLAFACIRLDTVTALVNRSCQITSKFLKRHTPYFIPYITKHAIICIQYFNLLI